MRKTVRYSASKPDRGAIGLDEHSCGRRCKRRGCKTKGEQRVEEAAPERFGEHGASILAGIFGGARAVVPIEDPGHDALGARLHTEPAYVDSPSGKAPPAPSPTIMIC